MRKIQGSFADLKIKARGQGMMGPLELVSWLTAGSGIRASDLQLQGLLPSKGSGSLPRVSQ